MAKPGLHLSATCAMCGTEYRQSRWDQRFCSKKCGSRHWRLRGENQSEKPIVPCRTCGTKFKQRMQQVYCQNPCTPYLARKATLRAKNGDVGKGWSAGKEYVPRTICEICGELFYAPPAQRKRGGGRFCSVRCRAEDTSRHPERFPPASRRGKGGRRSDLGGLYVRSSWEANWARYLNWLKGIGEIRGWQFEAEVFAFPVKRGSMFYTPDFKVTNKDGSVEFHEIKGYMDQRSETKLKRMRIHHPRVKVVLVDKDAYHAVARKMSGLPGWEGRR